MVFKKYLDDVNAAVFQKRIKLIIPNKNEAFNKLNIMFVFLL
jgi:hypothetical protein